MKVIYILILDSSGMKVHNGSSFTFDPTIWEANAPRRGRSKCFRTVGRSRQSGPERSFGRGGNERLPIVGLKSDTSIRGN